MRKEIRDREMKIQVLGCSGAVAPHANLPAYLIDGTMLLDGGTIGSVLKRSQQWKIRNILLTHAHLDHIREIPFLAGDIDMENKNHHITLVSKSKILQSLKKSLFNNLVWPDYTIIPTPEDAIIKLQSIPEGRLLAIGGYTVTAYSVNHKIPSLGFHIEDNRRKRLIYTGDTGPTERIWQTVRGRRIHGLIIEVSLPNRYRKMALETGHLTPSLLSQELKKMGTLPDRIFVTHLKPQFRRKIIEEIAKIGIDNIEILKDGQSIEL